MKIFLLGVSTLCLSLQSTGYAASTMMKEIIEFGVPAARRVISSVRPLSELSALHSSSLPSKRYFSTTPKPFTDEKLAVRRALASMKDVSEQTFSNISRSKVLGCRYSSTISEDDSWEKIDKVTGSSSAGAVAREIPPKLSLDDSWERIDEVTLKYCATTTGTIDDMFKDPANLMQSLAGTFRNIRTTDIYSRSFKENVIDIIYTWNRVLKDLSNYRLDEAQKTAVDNMNVIRDKIVKEMNR